VTLILGRDVFSWTNKDFKAEICHFVVYKIINKGKVGRKTQSKVNIKFLTGSNSFIIIIPFEIIVTFCGTRYNFSIIISKCPVCGFQF